MANDSYVWHTGDVDSITCIIEDYDTTTEEWVTRNIDSGATVTATMVRGATKIAPSTSWTCSNSATGADWPNGKVVISLSASDTSALATTPRDVLIEVKIVEGGLAKRWRAPLSEAIKIQKCQQ